MARVELAAPRLRASVHESYHASLHFDREALKFDPEVESALFRQVKRDFLRRLFSSKRRKTIPTLEASSYNCFVIDMKSRGCSIVISGAVALAMLTTSCTPT